MVALPPPVHLEPVPPHDRPSPQPVSERETPGESGTAAQVGQPARLPGRALLRFRLGELLPPAVPAALRHVAAPVSHQRQAERQPQDAGTGTPATGVICEHLRELEAALLAEGF